MVLDHSTHPVTGSGLTLVARFVLFTRFFIRHSIIYALASFAKQASNTTVQLVYISGGAAPRGCRLRKRVHTVHSVQYSTL